MKKIRKITIALLIVLCMAFSAVALTACIGPAGAQGVQGEQGPAGAPGKSAWELYKEYYFATYGMEYSGTEADWYDSIINPMAPHEHSFIESGSYYASMGTGVIVYKKCSGCLEAGDFVFVENATPASVSSSTATVESPAALSFALANHNAYSVFTLEVAEENYYDITLSNLMANMPIAVYIDGLKVSEGVVAGMRFSEPYTFLHSLSVGTHRVVVQHGRQMETAPASATIALAKKEAITNTTIVEGATALQLSTDDVNLVDNSAPATYYFTASQAGVYKISWNAWSGAIYESAVSYDNWEAPLADFYLNESYIVVMAEGAVFNFFADVPDADTYIYIEQIA